MLKTDGGDDDKTHVRLEHGDVPMFHTGPVLSSIGEMCKHLRFDTGMFPLDGAPHAQKLVNFEGPCVLDFSVERPSIDWEDDEQLEKALSLPLRSSCMADRMSRSVPWSFVEYKHPGRRRSGCHVEPGG